jgi:hypothetical protein
MTRQPEPEVILNREELEDLRRNLSKRSIPGLEAEYQRVHHDCRIEGPRFPQPAAIQQLVTLWRLIRQIRKRNR